VLVWLLHNKDATNLKGDRKMKKLFIALTIAFLIGAIAYPVLARGPGWDRGNYPGYGGPYNDYTPQPGYGNGCGRGHAHFMQDGGHWPGMSYGSR
jgi:hypothetical protein